MNHEVRGPYKYDGDRRPSFRVDSQRGIVARVYVYDGDIDAARERAEVIARALLGHEIAVAQAAQVEKRG